MKINGYICQSLVEYYESLSDDDLLKEIDVCLERVKNYVHQVSPHYKFFYSDGGVDGFICACYHFHSALLSLLESIWYKRGLHLK